MFIWFINVILSLLKIIKNIISKYHNKIDNDVHICNDKLFKLSSVHKLEDCILINAKKHDIIFKDIMDNSFVKYKDFSERLEKYGPTASFPEFFDVIKYLENNIKLCLLNVKKNFPKDYELLKHIGHIKLVNITNILYKTKQNYLPYADTIRTIYDVLEFFDIYERKYNKNINLGVYYHSLNYKYYMTQMLDNKNINNCIIFPTINNKIGATHFIKLRPVPIFLCGVSIKSIYVDEYYQSPLEFFVHDLNHSRRMSEHFIHALTQYDNDKNKLIDSSINFLNKILPLITLNKSDDVIVKAMKQLIKIIFFEIIHEDALYLLPDVIWNACHRNDDYQYVFEKTIMTSNRLLDVIDYPINVEGALAYTKFKLQYKFYDDGTKDYLVIPKYRYAKYIAIATLILLKKIYPDKEIQSYGYYLNKTSRNNLIPEPIHHFKVGDDENKDNIDITCLKTGVPQNCWKAGHRRIVGEHVGITNKYNSKEINCTYDEMAHKIDEEEFEKIYKLFSVL